MNYRPDQTVAVRALRNAAPYIRMFKGKAFVIKASGAVFGDPESTRALIEQVAILHQVGIKVVLVHGGGQNVRPSKLGNTAVFKTDGLLRSKSSMFLASHSTERRCSGVFGGRCECS